MDVRCWTRRNAGWPAQDARGDYDFSPGPTAAVGLTWRVVDESPFVLLTSLLSFSAAQTHSDALSERAGYEAFDLRLGALVGTTFWDVLSPYIPGSSVPYTTATARAPPVPVADPAQFPLRFALTSVTHASRGNCLKVLTAFALVVTRGHVP